MLGVGSVEIRLDRRHLRRTSLLVVAEGLRPPRERDPVEAGLHHRQQRAARDVRELEHNQRPGLTRHVLAGRVRTRMPAPRGQALGLHPVS
jgi:hypothetical protein